MFLNRYFSIHRFLTTVLLCYSPDLTWRDVQHLVVHTAKIPNGQEGGWTVNGAGFHVNPHFGFGVMDAGRMVNTAQNWVTVPEHHQCRQSGSETEL